MYIFFRDSATLGLMLFFALSGHSQKYIAGKISYIKTIDYSQIEERLESNSSAFALLNDIKQDNNGNKYNLIFSHKESEYSTERSVQHDLSKNNLNLGRFSGKFYYNRETKEAIHQKSFLGENIRVLMKPTENWEMINENKKIGDYTCYKAILKLSIKDYKGVENTKTFVAWYAPDLPFNYGPENYNSLPGIILELIGEKSTIIAKQIEFKYTKYNTVDIKKPHKGRIMTNDELEDFARKEIQDRIKNAKSKM